MQLRACLLGVLLLLLHADTPVTVAAALATPKAKTTLEAFWNLHRDDAPEPSFSVDAAPAPPKAGARHAPPPPSEAASHPKSPPPPKALPRLSPPPPPKPKPAAPRPRPTSPPPRPNPPPLARRPPPPKKSPPPSLPSPGEAPSSDDATMLKLHNALRARHHAPALRWDASVASGAQSWANGCAFRHSGGGSAYGENLYTSTPAEDAATAAVEAWYDEIAQYDFASGMFSAATGHATQLLWVASRALGCGIARGCGGGEGSMSVLVVCRYTPPGNYIGSFVENVLPE